MNQALSEGNSAMPARFGMPTASAIVESVEKGTAPECLDVSNNPSFRMKPTESVEKLVEALSQDGCKVTQLVMKECEIPDAACEALSTLLKKNHTIVELDLEKNRISSALFDLQDHSRWCRIG